MSVRGLQIGLKGSLDLAAATLLVQLGWWIGCFG